MQVSSILASETQNEFLAAVADGLKEKRREAGLAPLLPSYPLAIASKSVSDSLHTESKYVCPNNDEIVADFQRQARANGHWGTQFHANYYRKTWNIDTPIQTVIDEYVNHFQGTVTTSWEEWGLGGSFGHDERTPSLVGICIVVGTAFDGGILVTNYINEERKQRGIQPLVVNDKLRQLARQYLAAPKHPERERN